MSKASDEEIKTLLNTLFTKHDKDQNDSIDQDEAKFLFAELLVHEYGISVVEEYGGNVEKKFAEYFKQADLNQNGVLDRNELFIFYKHLLEHGEDETEKEDNKTNYPSGEVNVTESKVLPVSPRSAEAGGSKVEVVSSTVPIGETA